MCRFLGRKEHGTFQNRKNFTEAETRVQGRNETLEEYQKADGRELVS